MDCEFCGCAPATRLDLPTRFGRRSLCPECLADYLRRCRAGPPRGLLADVRPSTPQMAPGGPVTAARRDSLPTL